MIMYENLNMIECGGVSCYIVKGKNGDVLIDTGRERTEITLKHGS